MAIPLILDTDIGTDVDDALAVALALRHPEIELRAVTTVSGDARKRALIAKKLLRLAGRDDVEVATGIASPFEVNGRRAWMGHEGDGLLDAADDARALPLSARDAATVFIEESRRNEGVAGCEIAVIGMQTNVAAAFDRDPSLPRRVGRLAVMGGVFSAPRFGDPPFAPGDDHNLLIDPQSAVRALNAGFRTLFVPGDVTVRTFLTIEHLERLRHGDQLCQALASLLEVWAPILQHRARGRVPPHHVAALHDPLTVACLVDRRFVTAEALPVTTVIHQGLVRTLIDPVAGQDAEVVRSVDAPAFAEYLVETLLTG